MRSQCEGRREQSAQPREWQLGVEEERDWLGGRDERRVRQDPWKKDGEQSPEIPKAPTSEGS